MARARARAAVALALAVCCLLVATAPARHPVDLPPAREAAAEPLRRVTADCAEAAGEQRGAALAVHEEDPAARDEGPLQLASSSLLCLVFRCSGEPAGATSGSLLTRTSYGPETDEPTTVAERAWSAVSVLGKAEPEDHGEERPYETDSDSDTSDSDSSDSDSDSDSSDSDSSDSDSDDEDEGGIFGWQMLWRLADRF